MKVCKRCGSAEFHKDGSCAPCGRERNRQWRLENTEQNRAKVRRWRKENPDKNAARSRRWRERNPSYSAESSKRWREANPEKDRVRASEWAKRNPAAKKAKEARRRAKKTKAGGAFTAEEFTVLCRDYGMRCLACGKQFPIGQLEADHVVPIAKGGGLLTFLTFNRYARSVIGQSMTELLTIGSRLSHCWKNKNQLSPGSSED
jgi:uncharacterized Zn finger protein (UPF0148 family)